MIVNCSKILKHGIQKFDNHDIRRIYNEQSFYCFMKYIFVTIKMVTNTNMAYLLYLKVFCNLNKKLWKNKQ